MEVYVTDLITQHEIPFHQLSSKILYLKEFAKSFEAKYNPQLIQELASDISNLARIIGASCDRGDSLDLLMETIARVFEEPNKPEKIRKGAFVYLNHIVSKARKFVDYTPAEVSSVVEKLKHFGLHTDYLGRKT